MGEDWLPSSHTWCWQLSGCCGLLAADISSLLRRLSMRQLSIWRLSSFREQVQEPKGCPRWKPQPFCNPVWRVTARHSAISCLFRNKSTHTHGVVSVLGRGIPCGAHFRSSLLQSHTGHFPSGGLVPNVQRLGLQDLRQERSELRDAIPVPGRRRK